MLQNSQKASTTCENLWVPSACNANPPFATIGVLPPMSLARQRHCLVHLPQLPTCSWHLLMSKNGGIPSETSLSQSRCPRSHTASDCSNFLLIREARWAQGCPEACRPPPSWHQKQLTSVMYCEWSPSCFAAPPFSAVPPGSSKAPLPCSWSPWFNPFTVAFYLYLYEF